MYEPLFQLYDDDAFVGYKKVGSTAGVFKDCDIVRCTDMGYLFKVYRFYKTINRFKVENGKGGDTLDFDENADATWHNCHAAFYFGGQRAHENIFASKTDFVAMIWNQKFGVFKTFYSEQLSASFFHYGCNVPADGLEEYCADEFQLALRCATSLNTAPLASRYHRLMCKYDMHNSCLQGWGRQGLRNVAQRSLLQPSYCRAAEACKLRSLHVKGEIDDEKPGDVSKVIYCRGVTWDWRRKAMQRAFCPERRAASKR
eukprot:3699101-Pleurochrysis_carterae.AAC.3